MVARLALAADMLGGSSSSSGKQNSVGFHKLDTCLLLPPVNGSTRVVFDTVHLKTSSCVLCSGQQLRLFRRGAPYPTREERSEELKDVLDR